MSYILVALAVFCTLRLAQLWVEAPDWLWQVLPPILAVPFLLPWSGPWYAPLAVGAGVTFLRLGENLLIAKADESVAAIMRRR